MTGKTEKWLDSEEIRLLALMVLMAQLPMVFHVPAWLSLPSMLIVLGRAMRVDSALIRNPIITGSLTLAGAVAIYFSYGHVLHRDPCIAFLFMLTGFKLAETRYRNDATLLVVLCALLLLTQFFYWQSISAAILTLPGVVLIGLCLFQLQRHPMEFRGKEAMHITAKLFLQGLPVALLLFLAVPRMNPAGWGDGSNASTGLSDNMSIGTVSELVKSPEVALRVEFDGAIPAPSQRYWRGPVLSGFDGDNWFALPASYTRVRSGDRLKVDTVGATTYTVTISPSYQRWLPVLDTPVAKPVVPGAANGLSTSVNRERVAGWPRRLTRSIQYNATSRLSDRFTPAYVPGPEYLITTASNPETRAFAAQMRRKIGDDRTLIHQLLRWYNERDYHYTLSPQTLAGDNAIDDFMFGTREGFCEHFASSFVFILRAAGIPARVVTGYLGGEQNGDYMIVRQSDAHAWAEAFVDGQWQRFDPTSAVAPERVEQGISSIADAGTSVLDQLLPKSVMLKWDQLNYTWQRLVIDFDRSSQAVLWKWLGIDRVRGWMIVAALSALILLPLCIVLALDRFRAKAALSPVERQWELFCSKMARLGLSRHTGESANDYIARISAAWPSRQPLLMTLLGLYQEGRYGRRAEQNAALQTQIARSMRRARRTISAPGKSI